MKITMEGKYQTRDGIPVRLLATDLKTTPRPVVGIVTDAQNYDSVLTWNLEGFLDEDGRHRPLDLVPVPEPKPVVHQMWAVMKDGSDEITYSSYSQMEAEIHCNLFARETVRLIQWNTYPWKAE